MGPEQLLVILLTQAMNFSQKMAAAKAEGRELTAAEIEEFREAYLESDEQLGAAIERARAEGR